MLKKSVRLFCLWILGGLLLSLTKASVGVYTPQSDKVIHPEKIAEAFGGTQDAIEVIVNLVFPENAHVQWDLPASRQAWRTRIHARQNEVLSAFVGKEIGLRHRLENQPTFSAYVTQDTLQEIANHPLVESIEPVIPLYPHLAQGIPLMNASTVRSTFNGQGVAIAICDTGVDYTHPMLGGGGFPNSKVIGGYDFGDNDSNPIPNTQAHGTACAGIAAGTLGSVGSYIGGVAHNAKIYALKITPGTGGSSSSSEMAAAWDWCVTHQYDDPANPILVISTSFGGGRYYSACDSTSPSMTTAANNAQAAGITVLVSSGNDGYCDSISWPACISSVMSVGAVCDASLGTYSFCVTDGSCAPPGGSASCLTGEFSTSQSTGADVVTAHSNTASFLDILAPSHNAYTTDIAGSGGYSSGDYYSSFGGTSAACPYAAGAAACLQSAAKQTFGTYLSPTDVKAVLTSTGDNITDTKVAITKPRVNLGNAINTWQPAPPVAQDTTVNVPLNTSQTITLQADDDGQPNPPAALTYTITSLPNHGSLTEPNGLLIDSAPHTLTALGNQVIYASKPDCAAPAAFTFIASDGGTAPDGGDSQPAAVTITHTATQTLYIANMDTNPGWTMDGVYWAWGTPTGGGGSRGNPDPTSGFTGSNVVGYNLAGDYGQITSTQWARTPAINCTGKTGVTLQFYRWLNVGGTTPTPQADRAYIDISNNGSTWSRIWQNSSAVTDASWTLQSFDISAIADNQPTVYIRWGMGTTNNKDHYSGWNIDDVTVTGTGPAAFAQIAGDFEPDCDVDIDDLIHLVGFWLQSCPDCQGADLLADGIINLQDLALFAKNWLVD